MTSVSKELVLGKEENIVGGRVGWVRFEPDRDSKLSNLRFHAENPSGGLLSILYVKHCNK